MTVQLWFRKTRVPKIIILISHFTRFIHSFIILPTLYPTVSRGLAEVWIYSSQRAKSRGYTLDKSPVHPGAHTPLTLMPRGNLESLLGRDMHVFFGLWEETRTARETPGRHGGEHADSRQKGPQSVRVINQSRWCCEVSRLSTNHCIARSHIIILVSEFITFSMFKSCPEERLVCLKNRVWTVAVISHLLLLLRQPPLTACETINVNKLTFSSIKTKSSVCLGSSAERAANIGFYCKHPQINERKWTLLTTTAAGFFLLYIHLATVY